MAAVETDRADITTSYPQNSPCGRSHLPSRAVVGEPHHLCAPPGYPSARQCVETAKAVRPAARPSDTPGRGGRLMSSKSIEPRTCPGREGPPRRLRCRVPATISAATLSPASTLRTARVTSAPAAAGTRAVSGEVGTLEALLCGGLAAERGGDPRRDSHDCPVWKRGDGRRSSLKVEEAPVNRTGCSSV